MNLFSIPYKIKYGDHQRNHAHVAEITHSNFCIIMSNG